jgi:AcrR family transcriptional regulator
MRYPPDQKAKARASLLEAGLTSMKVAGFNGIGVDGLAAAAGVTSGAFYSNFANKEEMLRAIVDAAVGEPFLSESESAASKVEIRSAVKELIAYYISDHHASDPANGCVMPALSEDVARASTRTRKAYERKISAMAERIADGLDGPRPDRMRRAWSIISLMVGAITVSRAMSGTATQSELISSARKSADRLVSVPVKRKPVA